MSDEEVDKSLREAEQSVAAWLLTLELARQRQDYEHAAEAIRELRKRGVDVHYRSGKAVRDAR